jgi:cytochrome c
VRWWLWLVWLGACDRDADRDVRAVASILGGGDPRRGPAMMRAYGCGACHSVPGVPGASSKAAPPLDAFGRRAWIAGRFPNTGENLVRWIQHPQAMDPGTAMPDMGVGAPEAADIASYLYTLE